MHCLPHLHFRAQEAAMKAGTLEPENPEARDMIREMMGDENCRRKEMGMQVRLRAYKRVETTRVEPTARGIWI